MKNVIRNIQEHLHLLNSVSNKLMLIPFTVEEALYEEDATEWNSATDSWLTSLREFGCSPFIMDKAIIN